MLPKFIATYLYPKTSTSHFDIEYYINTHIPLTREIWEPMGLQHLYAARLDDQSNPKKSNTNSDSTKQQGEDDEGKERYIIKVVLIWKDRSSWDCALGDPKTKVLLDDVRNYTNVRPVLVMGDVIA